MKRLIRWCGVLALAVAPVFGAGLQVVLTPNTLSGSPGAQLEFSGTLVDTDLDFSVMFLNDTLVTFDGAGALYLSKYWPSDSTGPPPLDYFFRANVPGTLFGDNDPVDDSYIGPIFHVYVVPNTPVGVYTGTLNILGGYTGPDDVSVLAFQTFQVTVTPEPAMAGLVLLSLAGFAVVRRRE